MFLPKKLLEDYKGLKTFQLDIPLKITLYAVWKKEDSGLISIQKLKELVNTKLSTLPSRYEEVDLQIEVSDASEDLLELRAN